MMRALSLETIKLTRRFGAFTALDQVSFKVTPGTVHALLGENGAGKSTLVKAIAGYHRPDEGSILIDGRERDIASPAVARDLGIGMVYQHFTVVPGMTVAENLLLARGRLPLIIHRERARAELDSFLATAPFSLDLDAMPVDLSAGEKQKLEILKQLLLEPRLLILDEPSSVLTPQEAAEVLGALRARAHAGQCTVILITHKFREVVEFADDVTVLRRGRRMVSCAVASTTPAALAQEMVGSSAEPEQAPVRQTVERGADRLVIERLELAGDRGQRAVRGLDLRVSAGEIVGVAGVAGNGQRELMQALTGQRGVLRGEIRVAGERYYARRDQIRRLGVRSLPQEPLLSACVPEMSVSRNMALRNFDEKPFCRNGFVHWGLLDALARRLIAEYGVRTRDEHALIRTLSGGNVQRAVLARELSGEASLLLVSNPTFGLDFAATADIHTRLIDARNRGAAVLLLSEDLDELLSIADRLVVMSDGLIVHEVPAALADRQAIGAYMGGSSEGASSVVPGGIGRQAA
jgi:simple sugar transport system ATP-binding protein